MADKKVVLVIKRIEYASVEFTFEEYDNYYKTQEGYNPLAIKQNWALLIKKKAHKVIYTDEAQHLETLDENIHHVENICGN
jgi:hypothetical protein